MGFSELFFIAIGLSMDAFAVAVCKGLAMPRLRVGHAALIALFFGGFQAAMPLVGWAVGEQFAHFALSYAHWIAFALLAFVGGKMILDARAGDDGGDAGGDAGSDGDAGSGGQPASPFTFDLKEILLLAVATSIDALAVGVSFAFLQVNIAPAVTFIGCTTFCLSFAGVAIGHFFGARWERPATLVGGIVLVIIGFKILFEGLV